MGLPVDYVETIWFSEESRLSILVSFALLTRPVLYLNREIQMLLYDAAIGHFFLH